MIPIPDSRRETDAPADHMTPASFRLLGNRPLPPPAAADAEGTPGFNPRQIVNALKYHWFLFLVLGSLVAGGLGTAAWELLPAKYTTYSVLRVAASEQKLDSRDAAGRSEFVTYLKTQANLIKNEYVLRAALRDSKIGDGETLKKQDDPVKWLEENLIVEFSENSEIMKVMLTGENPQELADIVNAIQAAYMKEVVQKEQSKSKSLIDTLETIQKFVEDRISNQQKNVESTKKKPGEIASAADPAAPKIKMAAADFARLTDEVRRKRTELEVAREIEKQFVEKMASIDTQEAPQQDVDLVLNNDLKFKELTHSVETIQKKADYLKATKLNPATSPDYQNELSKLGKAKEEVENYRREVKSGLSRNMQRGNRQNTDQNLEQAKRAGRALELIVKSLEQESAQVEVMKDAAVAGKTAADVNPDETKLLQTSQVYDLLLKRINTLIVETQTPARVQEIQRAAVPIKKEMKKQLFGTAFAGLFGFALIGACITLYESRVMRLFGARDLTTPMNMIGTLPEISASEARVRSADSSDPFMEAVDQVRVILARNFFGKRAQSILIASAATGEGKTTLAGHLAVSMTKTDKKTIIVDCNLRQPGLHQHLGLPQGPGVCELLRGETALADSVQRTAVPNLSFLAAGVYDAQAQQAIGRDRLRRVLDKLRTEYDTIILDSHALLPVADTLLIGQHCDAIVMCARKFVSRKPLVEQAYQRICELGVPHTGLIFLGESAK
ncbi:MAG: polysaccharide biosynthesis tyrosine autokinase [Gemmataceae bacterium]